MANVRATKSGLAAEAHKKILSKYSEEHAHEVLEWISTILNEPFDTSGSMDNFYTLLKDGQILCRLVNKMKPNSVKKIQNTSSAWRCMENISCFLEAAHNLGAAKEELFQTVDLWEKQNLNSVIICLQSLGRKACNYGLPGIGPRESEKNIRHFTDEQLRASETIIGLQSGSNKGATQSGINFGNTRHM